MLLWLLQVPTPAAAATGGQPQRLVHNVTFYTNGVFTVDDGAQQNGCLPDDMMCYSHSATCPF